MSEQPFDAPADAPREFTPGELAAAREQLRAQGELGTGSPGDPAAIGMQALAAGAQADEVDAASMLESIRAMQARIDALEREKRLATAPDVVKYSAALHDHLAAKAAAHPVINADADYSFGPVLEKAAALAESAGKAAETGHPGSLKADAEEIGAWIAKHARRFPHLDYSYIGDLAAEAAGAVARLAA